MKAEEGGEKAKKKKRSVQGGNVESRNGEEKEEKRK
jgi:hypothetical protein